MTSAASLVPIEIEYEELLEQAHDGLCGGQLYAKASYTKLL